MIFWLQNFKLMYLFLKMIYLKGVEGKKFVREIKCWKGSNLIFLFKFTNKVFLETPRDVANLYFLLCDGKWLMSLHVVVHWLRWSWWISQDKICFYFFCLNMNLHFGKEPLKEIRIKPNTLYEHYFDILCPLWYSIQLIIVFGTLHTF